MGVRGPGLLPLGVREETARWGGLGLSEQSAHFALDLQMGWGQSFG